MSQHVQEVSHENQDEEMLMNAVCNDSSGVTNRPEILPNANSNSNTSRSTVRNSFNRSVNMQLLKTTIDELKELNRGIVELNKKIENFQYITLGCIMICTIALFFPKK